MAKTMGDGNSGEGHGKRCGAGLKRCAQCDNSVGAARIRKGLACPKHPDAAIIDGTCRETAGERTEHRGYGPCWRHGGRTWTVQVAAVFEEASEQVRGLLDLGEIVPITDPISALSLLAGEIVKVKDRLLAKVEDLEDLRTQLSGGEKGADSEQIDVIFAAYERGLILAEKTLHNMARLDLDDRIARVQSRIDDIVTAKITGALTGSLTRFLDDMTLRELIISDFAARLVDGGEADTPPALAS